MSEIKKPGEELLEEQTEQVTGGTPKEGRSIGDASVVKKDLLGKEMEKEMERKKRASQLVDMELRVR